MTDAPELDLPVVYAVRPAPENVFRGGVWIGRRTYCVTDGNGLAATVYCLPCADGDEIWQAVAQDGAAKSQGYDALAMMEAARDFEYRKWEREQTMLNDAEALELSEATARAMEWELRDKGGPYWTLPDGGMDDAPPMGTPHEKRYGDFYALPDFARDPHAIGYLFEWADAQDGLDLKSYRGSAHFWHGSCEQWMHLQRGGRGETRGEALCRAIVAFAEAEKGKQK